MSFSLDPRLLGHALLPDYDGALPAGGEFTAFFSVAALVLMTIGVTAWRRASVQTRAIVVVAFIGLAALYALLEAQLLFVVEVWVYAGAVMVLVLFVIMLLNLREEETRAGAASWGRFLLYGVIAAAVGWKALGVLAGVRAVAPPESKEWGGVASVAEILFTRYLVPFQIVGLLLLAVVVGPLAKLPAPPQECTSRT